MTRATISNATEDAWHKHLEFIQSVITRMARNSFFLKGWSVTLVAATFALSISTPSVLLVLIALFPALTFCILDAYYLRQERLFRELYDDVRERRDSVDTFSMSTSAYQNSVDSVKKIVFTVSVAPFHGAIVVVIVVAAILRYVLS